MWIMSTADFHDSSLRRRLFCSSSALWLSTSFKLMEIILFELLFNTRIVMMKAIISTMIIARMSNEGPVVFYFFVRFIA